MRKIITLLFLSILSIYAHAVSVEFSDELKFEECDRASNIPMFICKKGHEQAIVHVNSDGTLNGLVRNQNNGKVRTYAVRQVVEENGDVKYFNILSDKLNEDRKVEEFTTPITKLGQVSASLKSIKSMKKIVPIVDTGTHDTLDAIERDLTSKIEDLARDLGDAKRGMWVETSDGKNAKCEMDVSCPIKKCGDNNYIVFDPDRGVVLPLNFSRDKRNAPEFTENDTYVNVVRSMTGAVVEREEAYHESRLTVRRKVPVEMKNNSTAFFHLQDQLFINYLAGVLPTCSYDTQKDVATLAAQAVKLRKNLDLVHIVDVVNGNINSQYINRQFVPKDSCKEGDSYYTGDSYEKTKQFRPHSSGTISLSKANELVKKARAMKGMAWGYTPDGCYARAELMVNMFEEEGVVADKAWTSGHLKAPKDPKVDWAYHVAPVVYVEDKKGNVKKMIIDPAISDKPLEVKEWLGSMGVGDFVDQVGFPPSMEAALVGKNTFAIADRSSFNPGTLVTRDKEQRVKEAKAILKKYSKFEKASK